MGDNIITLWKQRESFVFRRDMNDDRQYVFREESIIRTPEGIIKYLWQLKINEHYIKIIATILGP